MNHHPELAQGCGEHEEDDFVISNTTSSPEQLHTLMSARAVAEVPASASRMAAIEMRHFELLNIGSLLSLAAFARYVPMLQGALRA